MVSPASILYSTKSSNIGLIRIERCSDHWFLGKLYLLPTHQNRGFGGHLIERLKEDAKLAQLLVRADRPRGKSCTSVL
jgi:GNAT superfamily N-acetyltransferase